MSKDRLFLGRWGRQYFLILALFLVIGGCATINPIPESKYLPRPTEEQHQIYVNAIVPGIYKSLYDASGDKNGGITVMLILQIDTLFRVDTLQGEDLYIGAIVYKSIARKGRQVEKCLTMEKLYAYVRHGEKTPYRTDYTNPMSYDCDNWIEDMA